MVIVIALCANKSDLFNKQEVPDKEGREYSESIGAIFQLTSAREGVGVDDLFINIGKKLLNMKIEDKPDPNTYSLKKENPVKEKGKKKCC